MDPLLLRYASRPFLRVSHRINQGSDFGDSKVTLTEQDCSAAQSFCAREGSHGSKVEQLLSCKELGRRGRHTAFMPSFACTWPADAFPGTLDFIERGLSLMMSTSFLPRLRLRSKAPVRLCTYSSNLCVSKAIIYLVNSI